MNCEQVKVLLSAYLDGELSGRLTRLVEKHLDECPECNLELAKLEKTVELLAGLPADTASPGFHQRVKERLEILASVPEKPGWRERLAAFFQPRLRTAWAIGLAVMLSVVGWFGLGQLPGHNQTALREETQLTEVCLQNHQFYSVDLAGLPVSASWALEPAVYLSPETPEDEGAR